MDNCTEKLQANAAKWQIPAAEVTETGTLPTDFRAKHAKCAGPGRSKTLVEEKDEAKAALYRDLGASLAWPLPLPWRYATSRRSGQAGRTGRRGMED